jgi:hypothetical protein
MEAQPGSPEGVKTVVTVTLKMTAEEAQYLDALVALPSNLSRSQVLRDALFELGEKYLQCTMEERSAYTSRTWRKQRSRKKG